MKIDDIVAKKKYWKKHTRMDGRLRTKEVFGVKVYVLEVDKLKGRVLASLNGKPAEWFDKHGVVRWTTEDPTTVKKRY